MKISHLYLDPIEFFRAEVAPNKTSLRGPAWMLAVSLSIGVLDIFMVQRTAFDFLVRSIQANQHIVASEKQAIVSQLLAVRPLAIGTAVFASFYPLFIWLAVSGILAAVAVVLSRDPRFREMLRCTGLALGIFIPVQVLSTVLLYWPARVPYNPVLMSRNTQALATDIATLSSMVRGGFPLGAVKNLNTFAFIWFGVVLTIGFRQLYRLKWRAAMLTMGWLAAMYWGGSLILAHL